MIEDRLASIENRLDVLIYRLDVVIWMVGINLALTVGVLAKLLH